MLFIGFDNLSFLPSVIFFFKDYVIIYTRRYISIMVLNNKYFHFLSENLKYKMTLTKYGILGCK